jgi:chromosome segregation protein
MRLKRVKVFGFKTFADGAEFDLSSGLAAIIGPNGCGKSNLVDAILWGLGEGSAKQLRTSSGVEVIFGGSQNRKPLGYAEVTLLFDNEDFALPINTPEVSITRKIARSGESTYQINRTNCRLKDIHELLADSGMGRSGYAIVGQREIDQALAASPQDRRAWIDEAAGTQRYRLRKQDSLRRLASSNGYLERVHDILAEIESQREPLKEEAEAALRYREIQGALREVESGLLVLETAKAEEQLRAALQAFSDAKKRQELEEKLANDLQLQISQKSQELSKARAELERLSSASNAQSMRAERALGDIRVAQGKLDHLKALEENFEAEEERERIRKEELTAEIEILTKEVQTEREALENLRTSLSGADDAAKALTKALEEVESKLKVERQKEAERLRDEAARAHREARSKEIARELKTLLAAAPGLEEGIAEAVKNYAEAQQAQQEHQELIKGYEQELARARLEENNLSKKHRELLGQVAVLEAKIRGLEMTLDSHEGLSGGSRAVLELVEAGQLKGRYVPIGEAIAVEREYATAIEVALGGAIHDLIVETPEEAKAAVNLLKEHRLGRATFQPITLMRTVVASDELYKLSKERGVIGLASRLVDCENKYRPVIDSLLTRVLVVETLDDALRLAKTSGWTKIVTLDGELVHSAGSVTGGRSAKQGYGMVQRRADLAELELELKEVRGAASKVEKAQAKLASQSAEIEEKLKDAQLVLVDLKHETEDAAKWLRSVREEKSSTDRQETKLRSELEALGQVSEDELEPLKVQEYEAERDKLLKEIAGRSADVEDSQRRLSEAELRLRQAELRLELAQKRLKSLEEQIEGRLKRFAGVGDEQAKAQKALEAAERENAEARAELEAIAKQVSEVEASRENLQNALRELEESLRASKLAQEEAVKASHEAELERTRADAKKAVTLQRLMEDYGIDEAQALALAPEVVVPKDASALVNRLRRDLRALGEVNLGAVEAYERLTSRLEELSKQKQDLEESIAGLQAGIRELDKRTKDQFAETFEKVSEQFSVMFNRLFGGGSATLSLTDPENLLDSGIDIDVQLPGKRRQKLELLSGGERSLCALAFLFALLSVRPSPLVVLDEVDAPLDGRNVERFLELLKSFLDRIQFLIVTHNPTTIAASPVWLGVTMQEPGVSTLLPVTAPPALVK